MMGYDYEAADQAFAPETADLDLIGRAVEEGAELMRILDEETSALEAGDYVRVMVLVDEKRWFAQRLEENLKNVRAHRDGLASLGQEAIEPLTQMQVQLAEASRRNMEALTLARDVQQRVVDIIADVARAQGGDATVYGANGRTPVLRQAKAAPVNINGQF